MFFYYFSKKPVEANEYFHATSLYGRPEEPVIFFKKKDALIK